MKLLSIEYIPGVDFEPLYGSSQVMSGAAEVIAYGTAVKYK